MAPVLLYDDQLPLPLPRSNSYAVEVHPRSESSSLHVRHVPSESVLTCAVVAPGESADFTAENVVDGDVDIGGSVPQVLFADDQFERR